nr:hypothetical protein [uncultured Draconibacterium sp.]
MQPTKTRIRLTWYGVIILTVLAATAIFKDMEGVASTCVAGILTIITGYQVSRAYTKAAAIKQPGTESPKE